MRIARSLQFYLMAALLLFTGAASAQDSKEDVARAMRPLAIQNAAHSGSSPFTPPVANDQTFVVDTGSGLDTGCTFNSGGPLVIKFNITRALGTTASATVPSAADIVNLENQGIVSKFTQLDMPAYDVDYYAVTSGFQPERDTVKINGHLVNTPSQYLTGLDNTWVMNRFDVPTEWLNFPADPGPGGTVTPAVNTIQIDIDTANPPGSDYWCTSIDWVSATVQIVRPVLFVHGIMSTHKTWENENNAAGGINWATQLKSAGIPYNNTLDLGLGSTSIALDSISNNAAKIATKIAAMRAEYGIDSVNLVTHSKGGIDSGEYVRNNSDVYQLIEIGTPNYGSPLADLVLRAALQNSTLAAIFGGVNIVAGPALLQLTTLYMGKNCDVIKVGYTCWYTPNSKVSYVTYPGLYQTDSTSSLTQQFLAGFVGDGDLVVPAANVPVPYPTAINNPSTVSKGVDTSAVHAALLTSSNISETDAPAFYNEILPLLSGFPANSNSQAHSIVSSNTREQKLTRPEPNVTPAATLANTLTNSGVLAAGANATGTIRIDDSTSATFQMLYTGGDMDLTLTSPSGVVYTSASAVNNSSVTYSKGTVLGGSIITMGITGAATGSWTYKVVANSATTAGASVNYALSASLTGSKITLAGSFASAAIHAGSPLLLKATLTNGSVPLTGSTVTALLTLPDATKVTVTLHDDGLNGDAAANDGVYSANATQTTQAGYYTAVFQATGTAPSFEREDVQMATVSGSTSAFAGSYTSTAVDTDSDGFYNELDVTANVKVTVAGTYLVTGTLTDSKGNTVLASTQSSLATGTVGVKLAFDGSTLYNNGVDGPYTLSQINLAEITVAGPLLDDSQKPAYNTTAYKANTFQHPALSVTGSGTATGVDTNNNKLFDQLNVTFGVNVSTAGSYQWSARLTDKDGIGITLANNSGSLTAGLNTLTLSFSGSDIGTHGVNGPYQINDLLVYGTASLSTSHVFTTGNFTASQFEGFTTTQLIATTSTIALTSPVSGTPVGGTPVTVSATVRPIQGTGTPTGTVTFTLDGAAQTPAALVSGLASSTVSLAGGNHTYTAAYNGDTDYAASSTSPLTVTVSPATTTLALTANPTTFPPTSSTSLTATVSSAAKGAIAGNITFNLVSTSGTTSLGKVAVALDSTGAYSATLTGVTFQAAGSYVVTASYDGNTAYAAASSPNLTLTVSAASTTLALTANPTTFSYTAPTALKAVVASAAKGTIAGNVTFNLVSSGSTTALGKVAVALDSTGAYSATLTGVAFKAAGSYVVMASYDGNTSYAASTSSNLTLTVLDKGDLILGSVPSTISLSYGGNSTYALPVTTTNGLSEPVTLTCSGLPSGATCQFVAGTATATNTITLSPDSTGKYPASVQFTVTAPATKASLERGRGDGTLAALLSPLWGILLLPVIKRRRKAVALCAVLMAALSVTIIGCSGNSTPPPTSSPITSTGTLSVSSTGANAVNHSYTFTVTLQ